MTASAIRSFGPDFDRFIEDRIEAGEYGSADEVLRAGLKLLAAREKKLEALRAALKEGEDSGDGEPFDFESLFDDDAAINPVTGERLSA